MIKNQINYTGIRYTLACDCCQKQLPFLTDGGKPLNVKKILSVGGDKGWLIEDNNHYCPNCWTLDGDEPVIGMPEPRNLIAVMLNEGTEL